MASWDDTIVAVSSPPGRSPRGLIRLSGPGTLGVLTSLMGPVAASSFTSRPRGLAPCRLRLTGSPVDTLAALVAFFPAPRSYTGQTMAEVQLPGNPCVLDRVLHHATRAGARLAGPGEFTFRAFLAGKLDLTRAEGIAATIAATSDAQLAAATLLRQGALGTLAAELADELATALALVEAGIDFVDQEDVVPVTPRQLDRALIALLKKLDDVLARARSWSSLQALPRVVLVGAPSTGKSTLFNALLGRTRAVVSPVPGTTRDVLEEPLRLTGAPGRAVEVMLVDLAGLDEPTGALDRQAQEAARRAIASADLLLVVDDGAGPVPTVPGDCPTIHVRSKADLPATDVAAGRRGQPARALGPDEPMPVSAATGRGLPDLLGAIWRRVGERGVSVGGETLALRPRHESALRQAAQRLAAARRLLAPQLARRALGRVELVADELRAALDALGALVGRISPDDVIGRIFATFCIGK